MKRILTAILLKNKELLSEELQSKVSIGDLHGDCDTIKCRLDKTII